jgi:hypothetical protein
MNRASIAALLLTVLTICACGRRIIGPDPQNRPLDNFNVLWEDFDGHYSRFLYKGVNWDSLRPVYAAQITDRTTDKELFGVLSSMLEQLRDSHAVLESPFGFFQYFPKGYVRNFNLSNVKKNYLQKAATQTVFTYGPLANDIGYIHINAFTGSKDGFLGIDAILRELLQSRGLVVDVRSNGGGDSGNAEIVASRFADIPRVYGRSQYRNGPSHGDFTDAIGLSISPHGDVRFTKKIALLTNRFTGSAAEDFVLMMRVMPHVTVVGDTTSGSCGGSPVTRELPNGWVYRIPVAMQMTAENAVFEGVGIEPDMAVWISGGDQAMGRDTILDKAIEILR